MKRETLCLHAGQTPDSETLSRAVPIHRTSSYVFKDAAHARRLFNLEELGNIYTRIMNPTQDVLEQRMAALESGAAALAVASGTNAIFYTVINLCQAGDHIVSANNLYGGTYTQFNDILPKFGITTTFVDPKHPESFAAAIGQSTKLIFCETVGNPGLDVADIAAIADIAHAHGIPLVVDSTFTTPCLQRPIEHGADIVCHSLTKWIGGHGTGIGGIMVDSGKFNWQSDKFPLMAEPDASYHDIRWAHDLGELSPVAFAIRMRVVPLRNLGGCISPDNAWIFLQGLETLPLRMERHCSNALASAQFLDDHSAVEWVRYPGLGQDANSELVEKYLPDGAGAMVVFGVKGGAEAGTRFIEALNLFSHLANVGDAKSLAIHPATTTHAQLTEAQQIAGGIRPELVRLAIGLEHIDDIREDLDQALQASQGSA
ncbi:MAG TPA: O-acetylhomoserine aminocarboxypropyltransferase [Lentisphaeria bacterium]|nr:O-acetylhomoserine aminocarboxypropyltransferase [Lentisphaeria bacterium]